MLKSPAYGLKLTLLWIAATAKRVPPILKPQSRDRGVSMMSFDCAYTVRRKTGAGGSRQEQQAGAAFKTR